MMGGIAAAAMTTLWRPVDEAVLNDSGRNEQPAFAVPAQKGRDCGRKTHRGKPRSGFAWGQVLGYARQPMIILLSPAKSLDFDSPVPPVAPSPLRFEDDAARLVRSAARLSKSRLKQIMPVSDALVALNHARYRGFYDQPERPAAFAFNGDVYTGLAARTLDEAALAYAQDHVRILSGLYGLLRPLDNIRPYRLEMGTRWAPRHPSLVSFWGDRIAAAVAEDLKAAGSDTIVNLASQEYFAAADKGLHKRGLRIITADFRQQGPDGPRFISFEAKRARGMAARFLCENRHSDPEALKGFDSDGYRFDAETSSDTVWRFIRA